MVDHDHAKRFDRFQVRPNMDGRRWNVVDLGVPFCGRVSVGWGSRDAAQALADALNLGLTTPERVKAVDKALAARGEDREKEDGFDSEQLHALAQRVNGRLTPRDLDDPDYGYGS